MALNDAAVLEAEEYQVTWLRQLPMIHTAAVTKGIDGTRLEWVVDSDYRFDLVTVHEAILPLGAVIWAAVEKSPGFTPEGLIAEIRRNSNYPAAEWLSLVSSEPIDPKNITQKLRAALDEAEAFVRKMPTDKAGLLFLTNGRAVQPDPARLSDYATHAGQRRGQWPTSPEISTAMWEQYVRPNPATPDF